MNKYQISSIARQLIWLLVLCLTGPAVYFIYFNLTVIIEWCILSNSLAPIIVTVIFDPKGLVFSCVVLLISANVLRFSTLYMADDKFINRFTILVLLFVLSINLLIYLPHFIILLIGWDGLGIVSFILVVYYQNPKSLAAGIITAITNRIGDVILLLSIALTLNQGHWNIINIWTDTSFSHLQILIITVAAITKRAQMPFSRWLPAAIAAPTPVSALVHSSTLVTAGVFLLIRFYPFLHSLKWFNILLLFIAVTTILIAGISATTECDIKKIIALSTLRQLGIIITRLGLNLPHLAYFHMVTHALFKALLFVCAGTFINSHRHSQDLRWIGNLSSQIPTASSCIMVANLALCGFPFIAGFYSKDLILEASLFYTNNLFMLLLIFLAVGLTSFYRIRFIFAVIWRPLNRSSYIHLDEPKSVTSPIIYLSIFSVSMGALIVWTYPIYNESIVLSMTEKLSPLIITIAGALLGWIMSTTKIAQFYPKVQYMSCIMWFLVPISSQYVLKQPFIIANNSLTLIDQSWLELIGGYGVNKSIILIRNSSITSSKGTPSGYLLMSSLTLGLVILILSI